MTTEYIKKDGKVYRREINEEEYNVDAVLTQYQAEVDKLTSLKTDVISKLK
jgi:hypothetical protein